VYLASASHASPTAMDNCDMMSVGSWYLASFSWSIMIITGTGGTDFYPSSLSNAETLIVVSLVIFGALLWTQVLAMFCDVATNANPALVEFRQHLDALNAYIQMYNLPRPTAHRLREYMHQQEDEKLREYATKMTLGRLSTALQIEVVLHCHRHWVDKVWFFHGLEELCLVRLAMSMASRVLAPGEMAPLGLLYVVGRGLVLFGGRVLSPGSSWGDDVILGEKNHFDQHRARAMSYVEVHTLGRDTLLSVLASFPESSNKVRRSTILLALRRHMVRAAEREKKAREGAVEKPRDFFDKTHDAACRIFGLERERERVKSVTMVRVGVRVRCEMCDVSCEGEGEGVGER